MMSDNATSSRAMSQGSPSVHLLGVQCLLCSQRVPDEHAMRSHLQTEGDYRPYRCSLCATRSCTRKNLLHHLEIKHAQKTADPGLIKDMSLKAADDLLDTFTAICVQQTSMPSEAQFCLLYAKFLQEKRSLQLDDFDTMHYRALIRTANYMQRVLQRLNSQYTESMPGEIVPKKGNAVKTEYTKQRLPVTLQSTPKRIKGEKELRSNLASQNVPIRLRKRDHDRKENTSNWNQLNEVNSTERLVSAKGAELVRRSPKIRKAVESSLSKPGASSSKNNQIHARYPAIYNKLRARGLAMVNVVTKRRGLACVKCKARICKNRYRWESILSHVLYHVSPTGDFTPFQCKLCDRQYLTFAACTKHLGVLHRVFGRFVQRHMKDESTSSHVMEMLQECFPDG